MATVSVEPAENALESIRRVAQELKSGAGPFALKGALAWGWHATAMLVYTRLQPHRAEFDAWVQDYLHAGEPTLNVERDARWENRERLSSLEMLDLLSDIDLPILKPEFYQGWQDKTTRCKTIRSRVREMLDGSIGAAQREQLLLLLAAYHRLIRLPAAIELDVQVIVSAFPAMCDLWELLVDKGSANAREVLSAIAACRRF